MKKNQNLWFLFVVLALVGCEKEEEKLIEENGLTYEINNYVSQDILDILDSMEMPIHKGCNPPIVNGTYKISPVKLINTNRKDDKIGNVYTDMLISLYEQNQKKLTIKIKTEESSTRGTSVDGYIVGDNNNFTIFSKIKAYNEEKQDSSLITRIYSGMLTEKGIMYTKEALVMLDDYGDPNNHYIEIGDTRIFHDSDTLSERILEEDTLRVIETTSRCIEINKKIEDQEE